MEMEELLIDSENYTFKKITRAGFSSLISMNKIPKDKVIMSFTYSNTLELPTRFTVQKSAKKHLILSPEYLQYINHSCNPNVYFNVDKMQLITLEDIAPDTELSYFYPSTEWKMTEPFQCHCESPNCLNHIRGAKYIDLGALSNYQHSSFIKEMKTTNKTT